MMGKRRLIKELKLSLIVPVEYHDTVRKEAASKKMSHIQYVRHLKAKNRKRTK